MTAMQVAELSSDLGGDRSGTDTSSDSTSLARCARLLNLSSSLSCARADIEKSGDAIAAITSVRATKATDRAAMRDDNLFMEASWLSESLSSVGQKWWSSSQCAMVVPTAGLNPDTPLRD